MKILFFFIFICFVFECSPTFGQSGSNKVILINIRGASKSFVDKSIKTGVLETQSAFDFLNKRAQIVTTIKPVPNAVTAVNNASLETGAYPETHGIVGNVFGKIVSEKLENVSGFNNPFQSETIWEKHSRQNKKVIRLGTLQVNGFGKNDYNIPTLPQVAPLTESQIVNLSVTRCEYNFSIKPEIYKCLSPDKILRFGSFQKDLKFVTVNKSLIVDEDLDESNGVLAKINQGEWFPLELGKQNVATVGLQAKLLKLTTDLNEAKIYFGPSFRNNGYPISFVDSIENNVGFAIGGPDYAGYQQGKIDLETLLEQAHQETKFMQKVMIYCIKNLDFDLLLYDHPILDRYGHYTGGTNFNKMKDGYLLTDRNLQEILKLADKNTSLAIVSGHGFSKSHTSFSIRKILEEIGENTKVEAIGSKISAHIYLNNRNLIESEKQKYLQSLKLKLLNYKDSETGIKIIDKVLLPNEMKLFHLYNQQNSGDLWICLKPGYTFDGIILPNQLKGKPTFIGEHGYFDNLPEAKGVFYFYSSKKILFQPKIKDSVDVKLLIDYLLSH